jgi:hypothetical protein
MEALLNEPTQYRPLTAAKNVSIPRQILHDEFFLNHLGWIALGWITVTASPGGMID